jgi:serine/threonine-protein kinase HipA
MAGVPLALEVCIGKSGDLVGTLWLTTEGTRSFSSFQYAPSWLNHPRSFAIAPSLPLGGGQYHFRPAEGVPHPSALPPPLSDTVPDSWGRRLLDTNARVNRRGALNEFDYLISADDFSRMGALRVRFSEGSHFLGTSEDGRPTVPPVLKLDSLVRDIDRFEAADPDRAVLARLLDAGTSLGGARPKCSVIDPD